MSNFSPQETAIASLGGRDLPVPVGGGPRPLLDERELALRRLDLMREKVRRQEGLPHLPDHGFKLYQWAKEYWESTNQIQLICAANQISKSSTQIRKHIHWATEKSLWPTLWPGKPEPLVFWYLYPTRDVAHVEWEKKWKKQFMPREEFQNDSKYGWRQELYHNRIFAIHWNSGVSTYFKTYGQDVQDLQTGTVWKLDLDEETPEDLMSELMMRLAATDGYLSAVFTATLGQEYWREAIEEDGRLRRFPDSFRRQVSMYDCLKYADGSQSPWTEKMIIRAINACKNEKEVQKRVFGKFVADESLKYGSYSKTRNRIKPHILPKNWSLWVGVDTGSGGQFNHPAAISVVAVSPCWTMGRVIRGWRGDGGAETTAGDVVHKVIEMLGQITGFDSPAQIYYDYSDRDFYNIAVENGLSVQPAEKSHLIGETTMNTLFKNSMLKIFELEELDPLSQELGSLKKSTPKTKAKDDAADSCRYAVAKVPWNWELGIRSDTIIQPPKSKLSPAQQEIADRRAQVMAEPKDLNSVEDELAAWSELMETYHGD